MDYEKVTIVGRLGKDPELKHTASGKAFVKLSVAVNRVRKDGEGNKIETTAWYRVTAWNGTAETCNQHLVKGQEVLVEGILEIDPSTGGPRMWERNDGTAAASHELVAFNVRFGTKPAGSKGNGDESTSPAPTPEPPAAGDDIPF